IFFLLIFFIESHVQYDFLLIVTLVIIPFSFIWSIILGKTKGFLTSLKDHFNHQLPKMKNQFFIFLSAGFLISAVRLSGSDYHINEWVSGFSFFIGTEVFLTLLPLVPLAMAFLGFHPIISLSLLAE